MRANDILLIKYSRKIDNRHGFVNGTQTSTEAGREDPDSDKNRRVYLGTSTVTDVKTEEMDTDKNKRVNLGTQTHTNTKGEVTDSDKHYHIA